jgi:ABC-type polysaccharide/polyol phosphate export permease
MLWGRFPSMAIPLLAAILFVVAMVGIALGMLLALFLLFRDEQQGMKKPAKSFLLSNWK